MTAACDFTRACPRYAAAMAKPHKTGPAYEETGRPLTLGRAAKYAALGFVLLQFGRLALALPGWIGAAQ